MSTLFLLWVPIPLNISTTSFLNLAEERLYIMGFITLLIKGDNLAKSKKAFPTGDINLLFSSLKIKIPRAMKYGKYVTKNAIVIMKNNLVVVL